MIGAWTAEFTERFRAEPYDDVLRLALEYCRVNPSDFAPSCPMLCSWIADRLRAESHERIRLPEPPLSDEERERGRLRAAAMVKALSGSMPKMPGG